MIRSRTFFDGSKGFILFSEESKSPAELVVVVRSSYPIQKHSPTLAKEKPKRGCVDEGEMKGISGFTDSVQTVRL